MIHLLLNERRLRTSQGLSIITLAWNHQLLIQ